MPSCFFHPRSAAFRPGVACDLRAGISAVEMLAGLALVGLVMVIVVNVLAVPDSSDPAELRLGIRRHAQAMHARSRIVELRLALENFVDQYGALPGDFSRGDFGLHQGNGDGAIDQGVAEEGDVFRDLHQANQIPSDTPLFLGERFSVAWCDPPVNGTRAGHYIRVPSLDEGVARYVDSRLDDGLPEKGSIVVTPGIGGATLYARVGG